MNLGGRSRVEPNGGVELLDRKTRENISKSPSQSPTGQKAETCVAFSGKMNLNFHSWGGGCSNSFMRIYMYEKKPLKTFSNTNWLDS